MHRLLAATAAIVIASALPAQPAGPVVQQTQAAIERIRRIDPALGSVIAVDPTALDQARRVEGGGPRGPLSGLPILLKDNIEAAGPLPTTAGSLALANNVTNRDAPLVARLRAAGVIILGKTNLSEWANIRSNHSISGWSAVGGQTRNPYALDRNTCGSSSGSGAAVAAGLVRMAIGTETDGSITCPAAINGIVGLKPTVGLVSRTHIVPISESQDTAGPMTASVREAAMLLSVIAGSDPADKATAEADRHRRDYAAGLSPTALRGKRIGVMRFASGFGTDEVFERALGVLKAQGATLVEIGKFDDSQIGRNEGLVLNTELKAGLNAYLKGSPANIPVRTLADTIAFNKANAATELALFGQETFEQAEKTKGLSDPAYRKARQLSFQAAGPNGIDRLLKQYNVSALVGPTMPPSWKIDVVNGDQISGGGAGSLAAVAGYPHLTVPMGQVRGLPVGLSFMGPKWSEAMLLNYGFAFEQARGPLPGPLFFRSIEESPAIAPHLKR
ncbi:amidase [Sphingomonas sp. KRR8]|uniref:amidase n=1 Tax=Sphingomonas sp. KRR8 TaxID=2942996 RepID=UPI002021EE31|nr:amidase [Sphingomonas sp. KRR8]URD60109.1 amidase [Sphingomonas sp. KRR8]